MAPWHPLDDDTEVSPPSVSKKVANAPKRMFLAVAMAWLALVVLGLIATLYLTREEQARDESQWQRQLQLSVHATKTQLEQWVGTQQKVITDVAQNESLALYLAELLESKTPDVAQNENAPKKAATNAPDGDSLALATYLRNLLVAEARRHGFAEAQMETIDANLEPVAGSGMAIFDRQGAMISSTVGFPLVGNLPVNITDNLFNESPSPLSPFLFNDAPYVVFTAPVRSVQADEDAPPIGFVIGMRKLDATFTSILKPAVEAVETTETTVVQPVGDSVRYLTPLSDGTQPLVLSIDKNNSSLDAAFSTSHPGQVSKLRDYRGNEVLAVAQPIEGTDWFALHKVDVAVAFADTEMRKDALLIGYLLSVGLITGALFALWQHMSAVRAEQMAEYYRILAEKRERDLVGYAAAQKKYQNTLSELIRTLVALVDSRDPNAQSHSECVAYIAHELAVDMQLSDDEVRATTLAGRLMNVGKIRMPENMLTDASISEEEKQNIRDAMRLSADILQDVPFDVPVVETLRQAQEHVDGSGPLGLKGDEILPSARIIAVVNAFVAMTSDRSYRKALDSKDALEVIRKSVYSKYHPKVCSALENYLVKGDGITALDKIRKNKSFKPQSAA